MFTLDDGGKKVQCFMLANLSTPVPCSLQRGLCIYWFAMCVFAVFFLSGTHRVFVFDRAPRPGRPGTSAEMGDNNTTTKHRIRPRTCANSVILSAELMGTMGDVRRAANNWLENAEE